MKISILFQIMDKVDKHIYKLKENKYRIFIKRNNEYYSKYIDGGIKEARKVRDKLLNDININKSYNKAKIKFKDYNIKAMFLSIDSPNPKVHNELRRTKQIWEKATSNINLIKKYNPDIKIILNHVLNKNNIDDFGDFIKLKSQYDFDYINPIIIKDCDELFFTEEQILNYNAKTSHYLGLAVEYGIDFLCNDINFFKKDVVSNGDRASNIDLKCFYPSFCAFVDAPSTGVYPCDCSIHRDRSIYKIGELKYSSFTAIWNGEKREQLQTKLINRELDCRKKCDESNCQFNKQYIKLRSKV